MQPHVLSLTVVTIRAEAYMNLTTSVPTRFVLLTAVDAAKAASHVSHALKVRNLRLHDISHSTRLTQPVAMGR
jgi:hypothetical protein